MNQLRNLVFTAVLLGLTFFASFCLAQVSSPVSQPDMTDQRHTKETSAHTVVPPSAEATVVVEIPRTQWCQCVRGILGVEGGDVAGCVKSGASEEKLKIFRQRGQGSGSSTTVTSLLAFAGCSESENRRIGSLSFELEWRDRPASPPGVAVSSSAKIPAEEALPVTCESGGVSTIQATLYRHSRVKLASVNPWDCVHPVGTLNNIPTGSGIRFVITGKNASGAVLYRKELDEVTIEYNKRTALGTVTAMSFVPVLSLPGDASLVGSGRVRFAWTGAAGSTSYQLQVSESPGFSPLALDAPLTATSYETTAALESKTYYWRVKATDAYSNTSEWSSARSVTVDAEPPVNTTADNFINKGAPATNAGTVALVISAQKRTGVTGYSISERSKKPEAGKTGWVAIPSTASYAAEIPFTLSKGDGNKKIYVWFKDAWGHVSAGKSGSILLDTTLPQTMITSHPSSLTNSTAAQFSYSSTKPRSTLHCALDGGVFSPCTGTTTYEGLPEGPHTFSVKAIDAAGNTDLVPARFDWTIDLTPPHTTITMQPPVRTDSAYARFSFSSSKPGSTFQCQIDRNASAACTDPMEYPVLTAGPHTFLVMATDTVGNTDPAPARYSWTIAPPFKTAITDHPSNPSSSVNAGFSFASTWPGATYQCQLDSAGYSVCISPVTYTELTEGSHTFSVKALDPSGNEEVTPAQYVWLISLPPIARSPKRFINRGIRFPGYVTDKNVVKLTLAAVGTKNVTAYYTSEDPERPDPADPAWIAISRPSLEFSRVVPFTMSITKGTKTVYVWFRDVEGNVSEVISDSIYYYNSTYLLIAYIVIQVALLL